MHPDQPLDEQHRIWEDWAQADPFWAILSDPERKGRKWDVEEFFRTGQADVEGVLAEVETKRPGLRRARCLDFGCGVGRLTQALAGSFDRCDGVDISETMIELARKHNGHGPRCVYHVNTRPDLSLFESNTFDFIYSTIVLQHNPPDIAAAYIREFVRLLSPEGIAVFDMTASLNAKTLPAGSHRARLKIVDPGRRLRPGIRVDVGLEVTNASGIDWPAGCWLNAGNHWRSDDGAELLTVDDGRAAIHQGLRAGSSVRVSVPVNTPTEPGAYRLEFDLVEEGVSWFADQGSTTATLPVLVRSDRRLTDRIGSLIRRNPAETTTEPPEPQPFTMNGLTHQQVRRTVEEAGGRILDSVPNRSGGHHWDGFRYFVVREMNA